MDDIKSRMFPYQVDGVRWLVAARGRGLLFDDPGLGKTLQTLIATHVLRAWPMVVCAPKGLLLNWRDEALLWLLGCIVQEDITVVKNGKTPLTGRLIIVSHQMAARRAEELKGLRPKMVAVDEAHVMKEMKTKVTKALVPLCLSAPGCILATGTPILNRPAELYPLLRAVRFPGLGKWFDFAMRYGNGHQKKVRTRLEFDEDKREWVREPVMAWDFKGASNLEELHQRLSPVMLRRRRDDVLPELPDCLRVRLTVEGKQSERERDACRDFFEENPEGADGPEPSLLASYRALGEQKIDPAVEWLANNASAENPVVVFAHHLVVIGSIVERLDAVGLRVASIHGGVLHDERHRLVGAFRSGGLDAIVCGITAASTGITLTRASQMLAVELPWSPKVAEQMEARLRRIGQARGVVARYMVAEGTYDEDIWGMLQRKASISSVAIDGGRGERFKAASIERA